MSPHVSSELYEFALRILDPSRTAEVAAHLKQCRSCLLELGAINDQIAEMTPQGATVSPRPSLRSKLLGEVANIGPYAEYVDDIATMLSGSPKLLKEELRSMPHPKRWVDGPVDRCRLYPCDAGSDLGDVIRSLVLMESGSTFPSHEHLGDEYVLVLQGSLLNADGKLYRPGDRLHMPKGTSHSFEVPKGLDLIYFNVVHEGLQIGDQLITPASLAQ